jgi:hypothetical protein
MLTVASFLRSDAELNLELLPRYCMWILSSLLVVFDVVFEVWFTAIAIPSGIDRNIHWQMLILLLTGAENQEAYTKVHKGTQRRPVRLRCHQEIPPDPPSRTSWKRRQGWQSPVASPCFDYEARNLRKQLTSMKRDTEEHGLG